MIHSVINDMNRYTSMYMDVTLRDRALHKTCYRTLMQWLDSLSDDELIALHGELRMGGTPPLDD